MVPVVSFAILEFSRGRLRSNNSLGTKVFCTTEVIRLRSGQAIAAGVVDLWGRERSLTTMISSHHSRVTVCGEGERRLQFGSIRQGRRMTWIVITDDDH
jgi:hypothetical protein